LNENLPFNLEGCVNWEGEALASKNLLYIRGMEEKVRKGGHSISVLHVHLVWCTKYRYDVLRGDVQLRRRDLLRQTCDVLDVSILKGVVSKEHIQLQVSYPSSLSVKDLVRRLKGRSAKKLLEEFP
jgi:putative transposase